jgi:dihydroorotate dehydrogenase
MFELAGAELDWPIGSAAGMTNHPDIEVVANRLDNLTRAGFSFVLAGSWTLGEASGGNGYIRTATGWEYIGGDEYVDPIAKAGYNAKRLPGPGTDIGISRLPDLVDVAHSRDVELALSLSPHSGSPLEELKEIYHVARTALSQNVLYVEVNLSCPNVPGRPPFYLDKEGIDAYYTFLDEQPILRNHYGLPGLWHKFGPMSERPKAPPSGGVVTSNTLANQEPKLPNGEPAITVNEGRAGMSGPALKELGRAQLALWASRGNQRVSALGIDSGHEVRYRIDHGADAVQIGSLIYWPEELANADTPAEVVDTMKREFLNTYE